RGLQVDESGGDLLPIPGAPIDALLRLVSFGGGQAAELLDGLIEAAVQGVEADGRRHRGIRMASLDGSPGEALQLPLGPLEAVGAAQLRARRRFTSRAGPGAPALQPAPGLVADPPRLVVEGIEGE